MAIDGITTLTFDCYGILIDWEGGLACFSTISPDGIRH